MLHSIRGRMVVGAMLLATLSACVDGTGDAGRPSDMPSRDDDGVSPTARVGSDPADAVPSPDQTPASEAASDEPDGGLAEACLDLTVAAGEPVDGHQLAQCFLAMGMRYDTVEEEHIISRPDGSGTVAGTSSFAEPYQTRLTITTPDAAPFEVVLVDRSGWWNPRGSWEPMATAGSGHVSPRELFASDRLDWGEWLMVWEEPVDHNGYATFEWRGTVQDRDAPQTWDLRLWLTDDFLLIHGLNEMTVHGETEHHEYNFRRWGDADPPTIPAEVTATG